MLPIGCGGGGLCLSLFCCELLCVLSSFEEESTGCFAFIVLPMSCSVTLPHGAVGSSVMCDCGIS